MIEQELYNYALDILNETNVYNCELNQLRYGEQSLINLLEKKIEDEVDRFWNRNISNIEIIYHAIKDTFIEYIEDYPCSFSFKQKTREKFGKWLKAIKEKYQINGMDPEELQIQYNELDTAIVLVKELHSRAGVTKEDLKRKLGFSDAKSVQTNLRKLCKDLIEDEDAKRKQIYNPFKIGGQPVTVDIQFKEQEPRKEKFYRTLNTLHPLVLQENLMQVGTLLQSLARNYYEFDNHVSHSIAIDIWSQLSDYAKERVEEIYAKGDETVADFINLIKDDCPNNHACSFYTERIMMSAETFDEMSNNDKLDFLIKGAGRRCNLVLYDGSKKNKILINQRVKYEINDNKKVYIFISEDGNKTSIDNIEIIQEISFA